MPTVTTAQVDIDEEFRCINNLRYVAAALPTLASSGHPGAPIGMAPVSHCIWSHFLKYDPSDPDCMLRDRFVLSAGHACALQYVQMHLATNYYGKDDLKGFRSLNSNTPGHPERNLHMGIEVTTGPLGLGMAQAVGLALGQHHYAAKFGSVFDNYTYCMVGDGCLQEGVSSEASSLAGTLGLGRLICLYDSNGITIDGSTNVSFTENVAMRYQAYGWEVSTVEDGNEDVKGIIEAISKAREDTTKPSLIIVKTTIGYRTKLQGTAKVHGSPLAAEEIMEIRRSLNIPGELTDIQQEVYNYYANVKSSKSKEMLDRMTEFNSLPKDVKDAVLQRKRVHKPMMMEDNFATLCPSYNSQSKADSTRNLSGVILNIMAKNYPELMGGSADLTGSNMTALIGESDFSKSKQDSRYIRFGVREFAMQAICNGLAAHGGFLPFCSTFLNFVTFSFPALRLAALSHMQTLFIATHDSIELGEDGPTHQAVEVIPLLRATPNVDCWRPCDGSETVAMYQAYLRSHSTPVVGCMSRGKCPNFDETSVDGALRGAYVLKQVGPADGKRVVIGASGTEVQIAMLAADIVAKELGFTVNVVSMPCMDLFERQTEEYQQSVFNKECLCVSVEACNINGLEKYVDRRGSTYMSTFGASAPAGILMDHFGFTPQKVADKIIKAHRNV